MFKCTTVVPMKTDQSEQSKARRQVSLDKTDGVEKSQDTMPLHSPHFNLPNVSQLQLKTNCKCTYC